MKYQNKLLYGKDPTEGITCIEVLDNKAILFLNDGSKVERANKHWLLSDKPSNSNWTRLKNDQHYKYGLQLNTIDDYIRAKTFLKNNGKDIYTISDFKESYMVNKGVTYYKGLELKDLSVLSFDIETTGIEMDAYSKVLLISNTFRDKNGNIERKLFSYDDETNIFESWSDWVRAKDPSIIIAHNGHSYDLPYLHHCASMDGVSLALGKDGSVIKFASYESKFRKDSSQFYSYRKPKIYGREIVDTLFLSIKYDISRRYESYRLKNIIKQEGLEVKDREFYDASKIKDNYKNPDEWVKIKRYAMHDADDALSLFDLMAPSYFYWCQKVPKSFQAIVESATGSQVNSMMVRSYLQDGESIAKADQFNEETSFEGAISLGVPGIYDNCFKVDVASLYPSIILQYEVYDADKDPNKNFLNIVSELTNQRLENKRLAKETNLQYYKDLEQSEKIGINSAYGFLGASGLNYNCIEAAAFITSTGREILKNAITWATSKSYDEWYKENFPTDQPEEDIEVEAS